MKRVALTGVILVISAYFLTGDRALPGPASQNIRPEFGKIPVSFIPNAGQTDGRADFYIQGKDKTIFFGSEGVSFVLSADAPAEPWAVKLDFLGANPGVVPAGHDPTGGVVSYFRGAKTEWKTGLPLYSRIAYDNLWPGIDLVFSGTTNALKYEFVVRPGADPAQIRLAYRGASEVRVGKTGGLVISTPAGEFEDGAPSACQVRLGRKVDVPLSFENVGRGAGDEEGFVYGFAVGEYDRSETLVLDPVILIYCGYLGGPGLDQCTGIAADPSGNVTVTGYTASTTNFPTAAGPDRTFNGGAYDAFVAKVDPTGTALLSCGYIGGSGNDYAYGIALDSAGNAYIAGYTTSTETTFPVAVGPDLVHNGSIDAFVAKVNAAGTALEFCGYVGGAADDYGKGIAVDAWDRAYIAGSTLSSEATFPVKGGPLLTYSGGQDAFLARVSADGRTLEYCGYVGGAGEDAGSDVAVDDAGRAFLAGHTNSSETAWPAFPVFYGPDLTIGGGFDGFVAAVKDDASDFDFCGYIGGAGDDYATGVDVDPGGNVYIAGTTASPESSFPVVVGPDLTANGGAYDAFVAKVLAGGATFVYCGYIGGSDYDAGTGIAVDRRGYAVVTGYTSSKEDSFPVVQGPVLTYSGSFDAFVARVDGSGFELAFCGYVGGLDSDTGTAVALGPAAEGLVYVAGTAYSNETSFPATAGPGLVHNGGRDGFVAKIFEKSISLIAPNGSEVWHVGLPEDIVWHSDGAVGDVKVEYSVDGGTSWFDIALTENDGRFVWLVAEEDSAECLIRISEADDGEPSDASRAVFEISADPALRLTSPNGGEEWRVGSTQNITWLWGGDIGDVYLEYTADEGTTWVEIATTENDGRFEWVVPDAVSDTCWIRISEAEDGDPIDFSDAPFSIVGPKLTLTAPNGGETWSVGSIQSITWNWADQVGDVLIQLSTDNQATWTDIATTENDGMYTWIVPDSVSATCRIRISEAADGSPSDISDADFSIIAATARASKRPAPPAVIKKGIRSSGGAAGGSR